MQNDAGSRRGQPRQNSTRLVQSLTSTTHQRSLPYIKPAAYPTHAHTTQRPSQFHLVVYLHTTKRILGTKDGSIRIKANRADFCPGGPRPVFSGFNRSLGRHSSNFTRLQDNALKLESSVASELERIKSEAHAILSESWSAAVSVPPAGPESLASPGLLSDIETFKKHLVERQQLREKRAEESKKSGYETPREKLIECLGKNGRRPLVCLEEFNSFKEKLESTIA
ncbi:hypothetical protein V1515DRAFT_277106 [Lipomyces mesembrius]